MKCISIRQPWASLILGLPWTLPPGMFKDVENRRRRTDYRGPMLIHASTSVDVEAVRRLFARPDLVPQQDQATKAFNRVMAESKRFWQPYLGAIVGQVELVDCVQDHPSPWAEPGCWHYVLANPKPFSKPVPYPGRLGLFDAPAPDANHLFRPHDGLTRRVCITQEPPDVMITRPGLWGNPFTVVLRRVWEIRGPGVLGVSGYAQHGWALRRALSLYKDYVRANPALMEKLPSLKGKRLGCYCQPDQPCHGDVLVKLVEEVCGE